MAKKQQTNGDKAPAGLTGAEWAILKVVWEHEPCAAGTVQEELAATHNWAYSTVKTTMTRNSDNVRCVRIDLLREGNAARADASMPHTRAARHPNFAARNGGTLSENRRPRTAAFVLTNRSIEAQTCSGGFTSTSQRSVRLKDPFAFVWRNSWTGVADGDENLAFPRFCSPCSSNVG